MSGMELLLRAAERTVAWSRSLSSGSSGALSGGSRRVDASTSTANAEWTDAPPSRPLARSDSDRSLPPKKRTRLGRRDSGLSPEQWQNILQTVMSTTSGNANAGSGKANSASKANAGRSKTKSGRGRRRRAAPLVRDVDGNDIGMGYFSTKPSNAVSPAASPVAVPRPIAPTKTGEDDAAAAAERRLCRAYLAALHRPAAYR